MVEKHEGWEERAHTFEEAWEELDAAGEQQLTTRVGTPFIARASITTKGRKKGERVIKYFQNNQEYGRCYPCCWEHYYNCNCTRIGMYSRAVDEWIGSTGRPDKLTREELLRMIEQNGGPQGLDLSGKDLSGLDLGTEAILHGLRAIGVLDSDTLPTWVFAVKDKPTGINLGGAKLTEASLQGVNLHGAHLRDADLSRAHLEEANLENACLGGVNLDSAYLTSAGLEQADLVGTDLCRARLERAVFRQALLIAAMLELGMKERIDAVEHPWDMMLRVPGRADRVLPRGTRIVEVFDQMNRAFLILGEPGSGKTTMLLELARDTIARAEADVTQPIPVVFNLSSWAEKEQAVSEWLVGELNTKYNVPKGVGRYWVDNDNLLLLLDGLDEVKPERREGCIEAINHFRLERGFAGMAVCSRTAEYEALTARLRLRGAVVLQPLTPEQIDEYLDSAGAELVAVRQTLERDAPLQELAGSPLSLSVMTLAYRGMSVKELGALDSVEARRKHLFDAYVQRMFEHRGGAKHYRPEQTVGWLAWLAQKMSEHAQSVFLIERMQPNWLQTGGQRRLHAVISGSSAGLIFGLVGGLMSGLMIGLMVGLIVGLIVGLAMRGTIKPAELPKWSWKRSRRGLASGLLLGFIWGLVLFGVLIGLTLDVSVGAIAVLFGGLIGGLICAVVLGVFGLLLLGVDWVEMEAGVVANQSMRASAKHAALLGLATGLVVGVAGGLMFRVIAGPRFGLFYGGSMGVPAGLFAGVTLGGAACIQHFTLRFLLWRRGHMPWRYARFLDYAAERILLRKVGGGYIFIHGLLQDYFAGLEIDSALASESK